MAFKLKISESELSRKLNGERGWKLNEFQKLFEICQLSISSGVNDQEEFDAVHTLSKELAKRMTELKALKTNGGVT